MSVGTREGCWTVRTARALLVREWAFVGASFDPVAGRIEVFQESLELQGGRNRSASAAGEGPQGAGWLGGVPIVIAAHATGLPALAAETATHFNGKINRPRLYAAPLEAAGDAGRLAAWDFSDAMGSETVLDRSANQLHGVLRHLPIRAVAGANWDGRTRAWTEAPWQYGAIHLHADDVADVGWAPDLQFEVPAGWRSGFYALRLTAQSPEGRPVESYVPFFVRAPGTVPRRGSRSWRALRLLQRSSDCRGKEQARDHPPPQALRGPRNLWLSLPIAVLVPDRSNSHLTAIGASTP
jgi:N,N-dimethylformamidase